MTSIKWFQRKRFEFQVPCAIKGTQNKSSVTMKCTEF